MPNRWSRRWYRICLADWAEPIAGLTVQYRSGHRKVDVESCTMLNPCEHADGSGKLTEFCSPLIYSEPMHLQESRQVQIVLCNSYIGIMPRTWGSVSIELQDWEITCHPTWWSGPPASLAPFVRNTLVELGLDGAIANITGDNASNVHKIPSLFSSTPSLNPLLLLEPYC